MESVSLEGARPSDTRRRCLSEMLPLKLQSAVTGGVMMTAPVRGGKRFLGSEFPFDWLLWSAMVRA